MKKLLVAFLSLVIVNLMVVSALAADYGTDGKDHNIEQLVPFVVVAWIIQIPEVLDKTAYGCRVHVPLQVLAVVWRRIIHPLINAVALHFSPLDDP